MTFFGGTCFGVFGVWFGTQEARDLMEDISRALEDISDKQASAYLDVPRSHFAGMRALTASGPGILRFAHLPARFWIRFLVVRARRFGLVVIEDARIGRIVDRMERLDRAEIRMAKASLPEHREEMVG